MKGEILFSGELETANNLKDDLGMGKILDDLDVKTSQKFQKEEENVEVLHFVREGTSSDQGAIVSL